MTVRLSHPHGLARRWARASALILLLLLAASTPVAADTVVTIQLQETAGASTTAFFVSQPAVLFTAQPGPTIVSISLSGTLTDVGQDGVTLTPTLTDGDGDGIGELFALSLGLGSIPNPVLDLGPASSAAGAYGPFNAGPFTGLGTLNSIAYEFGFTLSALDSVDLIVTVTIDTEPFAVPWAPGLWLLAGGLGALALGAWKGR